MDVANPNFGWSGILASLDIAGATCDCVLFKRKAGGCSALTKSIALHMWDDGKCGTLECPFFKPGAGLARIGDDFKPYTEKQRRNMMWRYMK